MFEGLPVGFTYAKIENGSVIRLVLVESYDFIVQNPERYGDASLYVLVNTEDPMSRFAVVGMGYNSETQTFFDPYADNPDDFQ